MPPRAEIPPERPLEATLARGPSLAEIRAAARQSAPRTDVARAASEEARGRAGAAGPMPDPMVRYAYASMFDMHTAEVAQTIPFPAKLSRAADAARAEARAFEAETLASESEAALAATAAYASLWLARAEAAILVEGQALAERVIEAARARYAAGKAGQVEVLRAATEASALKAEQAARARAVEAALASLNTLLGRDPGAAVGPLALPEPPSATATPSAMASSGDAPPPAVAAAQRRVEAAESSLSRAEAERFPDLALQAAYVRDARERANEVEVSAGISVPLWFGRISSGIDEAEGALRRARAEARLSEIEALRDARTARAQALAAAERFQILEREALPGARATVEAALAAYASGEADLTLVIDAERALLSLRIERERARAEHAVRAAEEARALGTCDAAEGW